MHLCCHHGQRLQTGNLLGTLYSQLVNTTHDIVYITFLQGVLQNSELELNLEVYWESHLNMYIHMYVALADWAD